MPATQRWAVAGISRGGDSMTWEVPAFVEVKMDAEMSIRVLGSAAGGGFPQWNCGCPNCRGVRAGTLKAIPRTQESVAVSSDGEHWVLLNASPEIRQQIESFPPLHPKKPRHSPIAAIVLTNGDLDH